MLGFELAAKMEQPRVPGVAGDRAGIYLLHRWAAVEKLQEDPVPIGGCWNFCSRGPDEAGTQDL